jgi:hypothetical protein
MDTKRHFAGIGREVGVSGQHLQHFMSESPWSGQAVCRQVKIPAASGGAFKAYSKSLFKQLILAAGIEPAAKIAHSPPPQAAGQPERFSRMLTYDYLKDRPREFLAATGLTHEEFARLLPAFTAAYAALYPPDRTRAGKPRQRRVGGGAKGALAQMTDKRLFILVYQKTQALRAGPRFLDRAISDEAALILEYERGAEHETTETESLSGLQGQGGISGLAGRDDPGRAIAAL